MSEVANLVAVITARTSEFNASMAEVNAKLDRTAIKARELGTGIKNPESRMASLGGIAGKAGLVLGGVFAMGLFASAKAAMEGRASQAALDTALTDTHQSLKANAGALEDAQNHARSYGFSNDEARAGLTKLEIAFGNTKEATKDLGVTMDLARVKHESLAQAAQTVAMVHAGSTRALKQMGIAIPPVTTTADALKAKYAELHQKIPAVEMAQAKLTDKQLTAASALKVLTEKVHGQADAYAKTHPMAVFSAQMSDVAEKIGKALIPAIMTVTGLLADMAGWLSKHTTVAKVLVGIIGTLAGALIAVSYATKIYAAYTKIAAAAQFLFNAVMDANPITLVILALVALGAALVIAWQHSATFRGIVTGAFNAIKGVVSDVMGFFTKTIPAAFSQVIGWVKSNWPIIAMIIAGPFAPLVALATNAFGIRSALLGAIGAMVRFVGSGIGQIVGFFGSLPEKIGGAIQAAASAALGFAQSIGSKIISGITSGLGDLSAVQHWLEKKLHDMINSLNPFSPVEHGGVIVAHKLTAGMITGISSGMPSVKKALESQLQMLLSVVNPAMANLRSQINSGFGAATTAGVAQIRARGAAATPAEAALNALVSGHDKAAQIQQMSDAQTALAQARAGGDPQAIAQAQQALNDLLYQNQVAALTAQAQAERKAKDAQTNADVAQYTRQRALQKTQLDLQLADLQKHLTNKNLTYREKLADLAAFLKKSGVGVNFTGADMRGVGTVGGGANGPVFHVNVNVAGNVQAERELVATIRAELIKLGQRNGRALGGFA
jgi:hypothetical protein